MFDYSEQRAERSTATVAALDKSDQAAKELRAAVGHLDTALSHLAAAVDMTPEGRHRDRMLDQVALVSRAMCRLQALAGSGVRK